MAETLSTVSLIAFIVAGVCFVIAIVLFFVFGIPSVIGDLSGRTAKKSIKRMRLNNENSGNKSFRPSETNASRGKLTTTIQHDPKKGKSGGIKERKQGTEEPKKNKNRTSDGEILETGLLKEVGSQTFSDVTELLAGSVSEAAYKEMCAKRVEGAQRKKLILIDEVMMIHTDEVI